MKRIATVIVLLFAAFSLLAERRKPLFIGDLEEGGLVANKISVAAQSSTNYTDAAILRLSESIPTTTSNTVTKAYVEGLGISLQESDPTVPQWAKASTKPDYTASEVGAYSTSTIDAILQGYLPLDYFKDGRTIPMLWGDGTKLCDFGANWLGNLENTVREKPDADDIPPAVSNVVTTALVRERLGVYLYVGADGGIYVHTNED